ncbi:hypothetical protein HU200_053719 [Digitaria exilis]|uniref:Protein kinase domain-containing protein n=1 Tax=Digitaria exilis TaxID=1010633 RepID=A0A835ARK0_9POAL|nr:hypothetical protein HU200_053719 [Digitaria exilis]
MDVIQVNFPSKNLAGMISSAFANLTRLQWMDLSSNQLMGEILDALTLLTSLSYLDVSNNHLTGQVPVRQPNIKLMTAENRFGELGGGNEGGDSSGSSSSSIAGSQSSKSNAGMIIGIFLAVIPLLVCVGIFLHHRRKKKVDRFSPVLTKSTSGESEMMKIQVVGTNGNSNRSGSAVPSELYSHGTLNGKLVAVKRCDSGTMGTTRLQEFMAEIDVLRKVRHRHLVALLGYCTHGNERLLVYEYMLGGTLREHLCDL